MLHKTTGIVFKTIDYSESSLIVQVFTRKFGMQSYLLNGARKPRSKFSRNMLQPLHLLDLVVYHKSGGSLQRISEMKSAIVFQTIPYDVVKSSVVMFLNEVLYKSVKQQTADEALFDFVFHALEWLDHQESSVANFHLLFMLKLSRYLGFSPQHEAEGQADFFDMKEGLFVKHPPAHALFLVPPYSHQFNALLKFGFNEQSQIQLAAADRRYLIAQLLEYYALHVEGFGIVRSHEILEDVLN
jgi:DNA repair protein RecO (recombination protein O)